MTNSFSEDKIIVLPSVDSQNDDDEDEIIQGTNTSTVSYIYQPDSDNMIIYQRRPYSLLSALARIGGILGIFKLAWILTCVHTCRFEK